MATEVDRPSLTPDDVDARIATAKAELHATVGDAEARVRYLADPRNFIRDHPVPVAAAVGLTVFLLAGGPRRVVWALRGVTPGADPDAYDRLPEALQVFVDTALRGVRDDDGSARQALSVELDEWARDPTNRRKAKDLAREALNGPPGPGRAFWTAVEIGAVVAARVAARKGIGRLFARLSASPTATSAPSEPGYTGWSRSGGSTTKAP